MLACLAALGPSGRGHRPTIFFLCCEALASALISQQSILKQGFQKTHFPMVLEVENFFAVDLVNF